MTPPARPGPLRFACTGCGACCTGGPDHYVEASHEEQEAIRAFLGLSRPWFRRRYIVAVADQPEGVRLERDGRCAFLGPDHRCRVYPVRPSQCRTYPFWPELVASDQAWRAEGRRCEGIGRGPLIPRGRVQRLLRRR